MLNYFFTQIIRSLTVMFRTIRAFFLRRCAGVVSAFRRVTNFSRGAVETANSAVQSAVSAAQKPTKREDYVEMGRLLVSKALILKIVLFLGAAGLLIYFVAWPMLLSRFFTARFYIEDQRVADWTGRVIVYTDKKKTIPAYEGRLEEGVLQGQGKLYDQEGVLVYEGRLQDGLRSGAGAAYEDGVLVYEGGFEQDLYQGTGSQYQDGELVYTGEFSSGVRSGNGKLYADGQLRYVGSFQEDLCTGDGIAYEKGAVLYRGQFQGGVYQGSGVLYPAQGQQIAGSFEAGEPVGVIQWSKGGRLYYEGEWSHGAPEGYGVLYGKDGGALYQGQWKAGVPDGSWLMGLGIEALRAALGEKNVKTWAGEENGFLMAASGLGMTARCSYRTEEAEAQVWALYLYPPESGDGWVQLLPKGPDFDLGEEKNGTVWSGQQNYTPSEGVPVEGGSYLCRTVTREQDRTMLLYGEDGQTRLILWSRLADPAAGPDGSAQEAGETGQAGKVEEFLDALDSMEGTGVIQSVESAYYGQKDPQKALAACQGTEQANKLLDAMLTYWEQAERQTALEENLGRTSALLEQAQQEGAMGQDRQETVAALEERKLQLERGITDCVLQREKARLQGQGAGCEDLSAYGVNSVTVYFDPAAQDVEELALMAAAYRQSLGETVEPQTLEEELKTLLLELAELYQQGQAALEDYQRATENSRRAAGDYATGRGDRTQWYDALSAQADARAGLFGGLAAFSRGANTLNQMTCGWVTRTFDWYRDPLEGLFQQEVSAGVTAVEAEGESPAPAEPVG